MDAATHLSGHPAGQPDEHPGLIDLDLEILEFDPLLVRRLRRLRAARQRQRSARRLGFEV